jgi:hypothetical protein
MLGGCVYKDHTFNKETAPTSRESSTIHRTNFHSTIQVREHYKNSRKQLARDDVDVHLHALQTMCSCIVVLENCFVVRK